MMTGGSGGRVVAIPNVTPMIDVMLVLLIIFMVVTPALQSGVVADPPVGENLQDRPDDERDHILAIDAHGEFFLDRRAITPTELERALRAYYPPGATERVLYVRAHRTLTYGIVRDALDLAGANGVAVVGMITEQRTP